MYRDASTPLTDELFATAGDIPDLQDPIEGMCGFHGARHVQHARKQAES